MRDEGKGDGGGFKGIYVRYLAELTYTFGQSQYQGFLETNARTAWSNRNADNLMGGNWTRVAAYPLEVHEAGSAVTLLQLIRMSD